MYKVAKIFVNIPIKSIVKAYSYSIPESFDFITVGWRVLVSFGNRKVEGFVIEIIDQEDISDLKSILDIVDQEPWFNDTMLKIAQWMSTFYLCSIGEAMRLFMPGKSGLKISSVYRPSGKEDLIDYLNDTYREVYMYIAEHQPVTNNTLKRTFSKTTIDKIIKYLLDKEFIYKDNTIQKKTTDKLEKIVELNCNETDYDANFIMLNKKPAQLNLFKFLIEKNICTVKELKLAKFSSATIQALIDTKLILMKHRQILRNSYESYRQVSNKMILNLEQRNALEHINEFISAEKQKTFLLHGITGSGKTQIYIEAVARVREKGKKAIVLVPEIALTSQIIRRFKAFFGDDIVVVHSNLSINERNDAIQRLKNNETGIVIGARSAIFVPIDNLGIIILDEEHDFSYKQDESPRYHTRDVAIKLCELYNAILILGSATPSIESYYLASKNDYQLLQLNKRIDDLKLPMIKTVDMREELRLGRRNVISDALKELIIETITKKEQLIILLNRRGFSTFILCRECGYVVTCPNCTLPMVYHKSRKLQCHFCDTIETIPDICPKCSSRYIKYFGTGTEKLEDELNKLFPEARIARMDRDTMTGKMAHATMLDDFSNNKYDILLGTQMVAKGHDIKNVTGVGIISADAGLNIPDFRAAERCFSLITQAAGRAGRGKVPGKVVVQTYNPEHYAIIHGTNHDYHSFYNDEIILRKQLFYPPYSNLIKLSIQNREEKIAIAQAEEIANILRKNKVNMNDQILGPFAPTIAKFKEIYRINIIIKTNNSALVKELLIRYDINLRDDIMIDINPINVM